MYVYIYIYIYIYINIYIYIYKKYLFDYQILKQNHAASIIFHADRQTDARTLPTEIKAQVFTKLIYDRVLLLWKQSKYQVFKILNYEKFWIASRDPQLSNKILSEKKKAMTSRLFFKNTVRKYYCQTRMNYQTLSHL